MKAYRRKHNIHKIPRYRTFTTKEITESLDVSLSTVRAWIKDGLPLMDKRHPRLIHGLDLIQYLTTQQVSRKQPLLPHELYCMSCQKATLAKRESIKILLKPNGTACINAKCAVCKTAINRLCKVQDVGFWEQQQVQFMMPENNIGIPLKGNVNSHLKKHRQTPKMTVRYNPQNERIKRVYFEYVKEAKGRHKDTIRGIDKALRRFEAFTGYADFTTFSKEQAIGFKKSLTVTVGGLEGKHSPRYSLSTLLHTVKPLQDFLHWIRQEKGYGQIKQNEIAYLNLSEHERQSATLPQESTTATIEQLTKVIEMMPCDTVTQRRDRALLCLIGMTGIRDGAVIGLRIKHYQEGESCIHQHPDHVRTKKSKLIDSFLLPVHPEWLRYFKEWVQELKSDHLFGLDDPLFPKTEVICDPESLSFKEKGIQKAFWANATPVRNILKEACIRCDIVPIKPHSIRKTLTLWAENACQTPEEFKAFSQNLGHNSPLTTFTSYGTIPKHRQGDLIKGLGKPKQTDSQQVTLSLEDLQKLLNKA